MSIKEIATHECFNKTQLKLYPRIVKIQQDTEKTKSELGYTEEFWCLHTEAAGYIVINYCPICGQQLTDYKNYFTLVRPGVLNRISFCHGPRPKHPSEIKVEAVGKINPW